jgi:hypothetical protein
LPIILSLVVSPSFSTTVFSSFQPFFATLLPLQQKTFLLLNLSFGDLTFFFRFLLSWRLRINSGNINDSHHRQQKAPRRGTSGGAFCCPSACAR